MNHNIHNGEIAFQSIFALIKRSFVRIVIFVIITGVVVTGTGLIVIFTARETPVYRAMVQFNYEGAEDGLDPWGRKLDVSKIKADNIITEALVENNFPDEDRGELRDKIKNNITIAGVVPSDIMEQILIIREIATKNPQQLNELTSLKYNSTSYVVSLSTEDLNITSNQCIDILNSIIDNYVVNFKETYGHGDVLGTLIAEDVDFSTYDYVEMYDVYNTQVQDIIRYLNYLVETGGDFRSTSSKLTFSDMRSRINAIKNYNLKSLETYIFEYGIASEDSLISVEIYIQEKLENIQIQIDATERLIANTIQAMDDFRDFYNTRRDALGNEEQFLANGDIYQMYSNNLITYQTELVNYETNKELWEKRLDKFLAFVQGGGVSPETKEEMIDNADSMIENINDTLMLEIERINEAVQEYMENEVMKNSIMKTVAAVKMPEDRSSAKILLMTVVVTCFVAFVVAIIVTSIKEKRQLSKKTDSPEKDKTLVKPKKEKPKE